MFNVIFTVNRRFYLVRLIMLRIVMVILIYLKDLDPKYKKQQVLDVEETTCRNSVIEEKKENGTKMTLNMQISPFTKKKKQILFSI